MRLIEMLSIPGAATERPCASLVAPGINLNGGFKMKRQIDVIVEGGVVSDIRNIPKDWIVKVIDFDVDGCEESKLEEVESDLANVSYWGGPS